jgi:HEAT repeat protein
MALLSLAWGVLAPRASAKVSYIARFALEKNKFILGEPIFCDYEIRNTGSTTFTFAYRAPSRVLNLELEQEPRFKITAKQGPAIPDPAPKPCGGAKGSVVYGSVSLPPGHLHQERWLLDQWARFTRPGYYRVQAQRRLPLFAIDASAKESSRRPIAYALALDELSFVILPSSEAQRRAALEPYAKILNNPDADNLTDAFLVGITLPEPPMLPRLAAMAGAPPSEHRWDRQQALEGMARLGTPAAWQEILGIARGLQASGPSAARPPHPSPDLALRGYAILLLGERADPSSLAPLIDMLSTSPGELQGDILRALGFFHDPRANEILFQNLRSPRPVDRVNAILGLRNLESKDAIPALIAKLDDPHAEVREVAHFALEGLTGQRSGPSRSSSPAESSEDAASWRTWWLKHEATFVPARQPPCHDW